MVTTVLYHVVIAREVFVSKKMDHVTIVCLVTMVIHAIFNVHIVLMEYVIKRTTAAPLDVKLASSWTDAMQLVLKTVTKDVTNKLVHVLMDAMLNITESPVNLFVQYTAL